VKKRVLLPLALLLAVVVRADVETSAVPPPMGATASTNGVTFTGTTTFSGPISAATTGCGGGSGSINFGDADSGFCNAGVTNTNIGIQVNGSELFRCETGSACGFFGNNFNLTSGNIRVQGQALTAATMTLENQANVRTLTHSYTWTNAQVVALGATTTGDITVATLPAKTQVLDAAVVITGAAAGPATVTVSCGDAIGGTPFINYVVASDAKAAANTVYGDAVAERGTSIDVEHYYLPSYTATTLVTCHFISSGANLSTVTGSTGRVVLTTRLLP
jgi:hypothetical protein